MKTAVSGLSKEQALLVLSTKNLSDVQKEQVLVAAGIIATDDKISASTLSQALAKSTLSATEKESLMTKLGLIDATTGEAVANATCTKTALLEQLAIKGIVGADAEAIVASIGLATANGAQTVSFDLLTTSIWANIKALGKWLITNPIGWAILGGTAIFGLVKAYDALTDSVEEVKDRTDDLLSSYDSAITKANENAKSIESIASKYEKLSKGVNDLGENVSLTTDEYSEYNDIVNQIADMFPTLISGYTDEGNAILSLKGNVNELRDAYKEAQTEAYNLLIVSGEDSDGNDIITNYQNQINGNESWLSKQSSYIDGEAGAKDAIDVITRLTGVLTPDEFKDAYNDLYEEYKNVWYSNKIQDALKSSGFSDVESKWSEITEEDLANVKHSAQATIQTYNAEIDANLKNVESLANAYLMTNDDYSKLSDQSKTAASLIVNNLNEDIANGFNSKEDVGAYVAEIVSMIKDNPDMNDALVGLFTMDTSNMSVDGIKSTVDQYVNTIANYLGEDANEVKVRLGFDDSDTDTLVNNVKGKLKDEFDGKVGELSLDDLEIASNLEVPDGVMISWEELKQAIEDTKNAANEGSSGDFSFANFSETIAQLKDFQSLYDTFKKNTEDGISFTADISDVEKLRETFESTTESFDDFEKTLTSSKSSVEDVQNAYDTLLNEWIWGSGILQGLNTANRDVIVSQMELNGIQNASTIVTKEVAQAFEDAAAQGINLASASYAEVAAFLAESNASDTCKQSIAALEFAKIACNNAVVSTSGDIDNIIALANAAGAAAAQLAQLQAAKNDMLAAEKAAKSGVKGISDLNRDYYAQENTTAAATAIWQNIDSNKFKANGSNANSSSGGSGGSGGNGGSGGSGGNGGSGNDSKNSDTKESIALDKLKSKLSILERQAGRMNNFISLKEAFELTVSSKDYDRLLVNQTKQISNIEAQNKVIRKQQSLVAKNSKEWLEYQATIESNKESMTSLTNAMAENAKTSAGLAKAKAEKKNDKIDNSDDFLDSKIENTNSVSKKNKYINSQINNTYKRNANNKTAYNTVLKNKKSTKNKINNLAKTNKTGKYVKLFKEVQTKVKRNAKISASTINNISVALSKESNNRKRSQLNALLIRAINWNELMIAEQEAEAAYKIYAQTSIAERKELLQQQRDNLDSKRDDTIERIENNYGASTNNYSYTTSSKNSTLYTMNKQIKAERKAYHSSTVAAANLLKASKKGTYANKTVSSINKAIKAINKLKKKDKKKAAAYKKALNQARSCIKAKKKIPDSILKIIAKNNAGIYERCVNHNSNVDTYNLKAYEESLYYASSLQDYYSNKESFVDNKIAEEDRQDELIEAKKNLVSSAKDKNKYIDAEIQNIKDRLNTYNSEKQKAASNFTDTKRSLTAAYGTTASAKSSTGKKSKKYDTYIQQAISNARAGKEISASTIQKLEAGVNDGVVSVGFVNACNDYNAALEYKESTANEAALYELTSQQDISTKTLEKLQNLSDERHDKYNTDKISTISNLISDDMLFDDKGNATKYFSVKLNLALEGYENAKKDAESYKTDISELEAAYKTGAITAEDYNSKLKELQTSYLNSAESVKNFADEISGYLVNTQQKELETLNKVIDARKEALQKKKDYYDYDKSLKSKTKEINLIKAQIAALEGLTDAESKAQKAKLEAQMQEVQAEIDDAVQEHVYNLQVSGLEDLSDNLQDSYDAYVKELSSNFEKINELIKNLSDTATMSADEVSRAINEILKNYGVDSSIVNVSNTPHMATGGFVKEVKNAGDDGLATLAVGENVLNKELTTLSLKTIPAFNELMENSVLNMLPNPIVNLPELPSATNNMRFRTVEIKPEINFTVEGNVDKFVLEDLKKFQKETVNKTISALAKDLKKIM